MEKQDNTGATGAQKEGKKGGRLKLASATLLTPLEMNRFQILKAHTVITFDNKTSD